ncbi:IS21 family transposase [Xylanimonas cellulosilytica]|nr:IS21 family transposase [Xylanimonas cellulosilytica]
MISMEDWAEIRRLHRSEGVPIKAIARRLGVARNTVRAALAASDPPRYSRPAKGSLVDEVESLVREQLRLDPTMPATVIAKRIGWTRSLTILKDRIRDIRPEYRGIDPADRVVHKPGDTVQCDLWFPEPRIAVGHGQAMMLPVLVMVATYSRYMCGVMVPSRRSGDLTAAMWQLLGQMNAVPHRLWWDRESAIATTRGVPTQSMRAFVGSLGTRAVIAPAADPEFKGGVERHNRYLESSFLPGRRFTGPGDFNAQLGGWLAQDANQRVVRALGARPAEVFERERPLMLPLPPVAPTTGWHHRVRLGRDYYVRLDSNDYSVDPSVIGRMVEVHADLTRVWVTCEDRQVASHARCWADHATITDPAHVATAAVLRRQYQQTAAARAEQARLAGARTHADGTIVPLRALSDYDTLFGIDPALGHAAAEDGQGVAG